MIHHLFDALPLERRRLRIRLLVRQKCIAHRLLQAEQVCLGSAQLVAALAGLLRHTDNWQQARQFMAAFVVALALLFGVSLLAKDDL